MRYFLPTIALFWAVIFAPQFLSATSIIPFANLGEATTYSGCVVLARAMETVETTENGTSFRDTKFESVESVKGVLLPGSLFFLRPLSRQSGDFKIDIAGDFKPEIGKTYLLFLYQNGDVWQPVMLSYYVFEQIHLEDEYFLVSTGALGMNVLKRPDGQPIEPLGVFYPEILLQHLQAFADSPLSAWDGTVGRCVLRVEDFESLDRAIPMGCDFAIGANNTRWQNAAIPVYYDDTGNPPDWGSLFSNILSAMNDQYTGINPTDAGSKSYTPNCVDGSAYLGNFIPFCNANLGGSQCALIIFEDPCNEIANLSGCAGTLAYGGSYSGSTHQFDGLTWNSASYGFVVVNNGVADCLFGTDYERLMTHELTHAYCMDHLNETDYPDQNMNPLCCNAINTKDQECMDYAYPPPLPVSLLSFEARLQEDGYVKLKWVTESEKDNDHFTLQRSTNGIQYEMIQVIASSGSSAGGTYEWLDTRPLAGLNYYLLSQTDFDGTEQRLSIKSVTAGKSDHLLTINGNPVKGENLSYNLVVAAVFNGTLEILDTDGRTLVSTPLLLEKGTQILQQPIGKLPAGIYLLRLFDGSQQWATRFLKQ